MYFAKTPTATHEQALREQIERERRELHAALMALGMSDPPVELRIEASNPRPDCIFFTYRHGLTRGDYDVRTFAEAYAAYEQENRPFTIHDAISRASFLYATSGTPQQVA